MAAVAEALARQQEARGSKAAAERARALAAPGAAAVVTGQQAGLFGGPLFVLWKALETVAVARRLEAERHKPVVPVFWVASDDHDFAEVRATTIVDASGALRTLRYDPQQEPLGRPAWDIVLDDTVGGLVEELARALPASTRPGRDGGARRVLLSRGRDDRPRPSRGSSRACCPSSSCSTLRTRRSSG